MGLVQEYDIIASEDIRKLEDALKEKNNKNPIALQPTSSSTSEGLIEIQNGFFNLLKDFILILPDSSIQEVLTHYVTVDVILVMANHHNVKVRTSIVRLLTHMCQRLNETTSTQYQKSFYWHHLGNQVALHSVNLQLVQACCQWITGSCLTLKQMVI